VTTGREAVTEPKEERRVRERQTKEGGGRKTEGRERKKLETGKA